MIFTMGHRARVPRKKLFYGWVIVFASMLMMMISLGLVGNCNSLFIVPICNDIGISRAEGALLSTISGIAGMVLSALSAKLYTKISVRRSMQIGAVILMLGYASIGLVRNKWMLYGSYSVTTLAMWSMGYVPFAVILSNWFERRTGFVVGLVYMGTGIGGMLFSPVIGALIHSFGWRMTYLIMSVVVGLLLIPTSFLIFDKPSDKGLLPYGHEPNLEKAPLDKSMLSGTPYSSAIRSAAFWIIVTAICFTNFMVSGYHSTFAAFLSDIGYPITSASAIVSLNMASLAAGKILLGFLFDRFGYNSTSILAGISTIVCIVAALFLPSTIALVIQISMYSLGMGYGSVAPPILLKYKFGLNDFAKINGLLMTCSQVFSALGSVFSGTVRDLAGSYAPGYIFLAVMILITRVILIPVLKPSKNASTEVLTHA